MLRWQGPLPSFKSTNLIVPLLQLDNIMIAKVAKEVLEEFEKLKEEELESKYAAKVQKSISTAPLDKSRELTWHFASASCHGHLRLGCQ